jgi:hypothetical protein
LKKSQQVLEQHPSCAIEWAKRSKHGKEIQQIVEQGVAERWTAGEILDTIFLTMADKKFQFPLVKDLLRQWFCSLLPLVSNVGPVKITQRQLGKWVGIPLENTVYPVKMERSFEEPEPVKFARRGEHTTRLEQELRKHLLTIYKKEGEL